MTHQHLHLSASALVLCLAGGVAQADVTPQQVWQDLANYVEGFGYSVEGTETMDGDTLRVTDAAFVMALPEGEEGSIRFDMSEVTLTPAADGAVAVTFPASMPITAEFEGDFGEDIAMVMDYTQSGLEMLVTGEPDNITYSYTADSVGLALSDMTAGDEVIDRDLATVEITTGPLEGSSTTTLADDMRGIVQSAAMESLQYTLSFADPEGGGQGSLAGEMVGISFAGNSQTPKDFNPALLENLGEANLSGSGTFSHQGNSATFSAVENGTTMGGESTSDGATVSVALADDTLRYDVSADGVAMAFEGGELPFPVQFAMANMAFLVDIPMAASETPQDMELAMTLGGFTMSDLLWSLFDAGAALPRDPATVAIELAGKVTPFVSLYDAEAMALLEQTGGVPGELNALTLKNLTVDAAGVRLTGNGDVTFDTEGGPGLGGMPRPIGEVNVQLQGANALIDKLIQMGLLAESDALGARMMMGMFTVPQSGPDDLSSKIEFTEEGQILANGQRIQ